VIEPHNLCNKVVKFLYAFPFFFPFFFFFFLFGICKLYIRTMNAHVSSMLYFFDCMFSENKVG
jgi:hypothetical protein